MLEVGGSVHSMVLKAGFGSDSHVNNTLLTMYSGCGVVGLSRKVFDEMRARDVVSWSSMVSAYVDRYADSPMILYSLLFLVWWFKVLVSVLTHLLMLAVTLI